MTIRQLWVRVKAVLGDPESPLVRAIRLAEADAAEMAEVQGIDDALALLNRNGGG